MMWQSLRRSYRQYLQLERGLSRHSIDAYLRDLDKLHQYLEAHHRGVAVTELSPQHLRGYVQFLHELGLSARTQARMTSAMRNFFAYLVEEGVIEDNPALEIDLPKLRRHLPEVLSVEEVERILRAVDLSHPMGHRDRAILETLYACGLRVSELIHLESASVYSEEGFIRVIGKNNKERYIPIAPTALHQIELYRQHVRRHLPIAPDSAHILFLNHRGRKLSRVAVFQMIKKYTHLAGIRKNVSPHTFRHSFATHLVEGGADLRVVQQLLGHASILTTEIYTHIQREYLRETLLRYHPLHQGED